ncbi:DeoR/GlpR family DNA-binding transcription regulator [Variovorax sp. RHLX14]|uniref:DeoR/GlpR family DNA-binding transcription regulator n=1 Tax=Variovorax sp. RHLX14 TaxID=1259731 RepID=UPI003F4966BD
MPLPHRQAEIISRLNQEGRVTVTELMQGLQVSDETVRRDLRELESLGLVRRIHGGAITPKSDQEEPLLARERFNIREKARIGQLASRMVSDGMSLFLDTGTTTLAFARRLTAKNLRVTTNSLDIALALRDQGALVEMTPGTLRSNDNALVGIETLDYAKRRYYDIAFMGIGACTIAHGWTDYAQEESALRRILLGQARQPVLLVDHSKFGRQAYVRTFSLAEVDCIVCDKRPPRALQEVFDAGNIRVVFE